MEAECFFHCFASQHPHYDHGDQPSPSIYLRLRDGQSQELTGGSHPTDMGLVSGFWKVGMCLFILQMTQLRLQGQRTSENPALINETPEI